MQIEQTKLSAIPQFPTMLSYSIRTEGSGNQKTHIVVAEYPDCQREFDGKTWKVTADYRNGKQS